MLHSLVMYHPSNICDVGTFGKPLENIRSPNIKPGEIFAKQTT